MYNAKLAEGHLLSDKMNVELNVSIMHAGMTMWTFKDAGIVGELSLAIFVIWLDLEQLYHSRHIAPITMITSFMIRARKNCISESPYRSWPVHFL